MTGAAVPPAVAEVCATFLTAADTAAPGLVTGLYLIGSVALGDFHDDAAPGPRHHSASDIDFVAMLDVRPDAVAVAALDAAHHAVRERHPRLAFEGTHLTAGELAAGPAGVAGAPSAFQGGFQATSPFAVNPVTWHELATAGIAVRGPAAADLPVWTDATAFRAFTVDNLTSYWRRCHTRYAGAVDQILAKPDAPEWVAQWCVLGVSRLYAELARGGLATKCGGAGYALSAFDARWHPLIVDCLGIRGAHPSRYGDGDRARLVRDSVDYLDMAIDAALALADPV